MGHLNNLNIQLIFLFNYKYVLHLDIHCGGDLKTVLVMNGLKLSFIE